MTDVLLSWYAGGLYPLMPGALEGYVTTLVLESGGWSLDIEEEARAKYTEIIAFYKKAGALIFELEAAMKIARFICR